MPKFRVRTLAIVVAVAAIVLAAFLLVARSRAYLGRSAQYRVLEAWYRASAEGWSSGSKPSPEVSEACREAADRYARLSQKYGRAAGRPWLAVEPDPPRVVRRYLMTTEGLSLEPAADDLIHIAAVGLMDDLAGWTPLQRSIYLTALDESRPMSEIARALSADPGAVRHAIEPLFGTLLWDRSKDDPVVTIRD